MHLLRGGGEQHSAQFAQRNPARPVPVLEDGAPTLTQSLAIIEYLEETHPEPALLPSAAAARARVRALALSIACDIHPLNNLRVLRYLKSPLAIDDAAARRMDAALDRARIRGALERTLAAGSGSTGTLLLRRYADAGRLLPDPAGVQRAARESAHSSPIRPSGASMQHCMRLEPFARAAPAAQADAE